MEQRVSLVTLGVRDLPRARRFYERLGWRGQEVEETVFLQAGGLVVVLWDRDKLAVDCGLDPGADGAEDGAPPSFGGIALAHNVRRREEVDEVLAAARDAGAVVTRPAAPTFYGGWAGVFTDPDGHAWEIAHNPGFPLAADGSLVLPDLGAPARLDSGRG
ncbi:VOC family protein [Kineococcus gynurae]|uniref:VOC family protein n=1 Tax=Kineococcus gynurae TaxID=452979 RepID=A0ABV5LUE0_9ACTN